MDTWELFKSARNIADLFLSDSSSLFIVERTQTGRTTLFKQNIHTKETIEWLDSAFSVGTSLMDYGPRCWVFTDQNFFFVNKRDGCIWKKNLHEMSSPPECVQSFEQGVKAGYLSWCKINKTVVYAVSLGDRPGIGIGRNIFWLPSEYFCINPILSPDGRSLAFLQWAEPRMPFQGTQIVLANINFDLTLGKSVDISAGPSVMATEISWDANGELCALMDFPDRKDDDIKNHLGFYRYRDGEWSSQSHLPVDLGANLWCDGTAGYLETPLGTFFSERWPDSERLVLLQKDGSWKNFRHKAIGFRNFTFHPDVGLGFVGYFSETSPEIFFIAKRDLVC